ncbi:hypothetical protein CB1_000592002 [Camelus ferus]|nr:hypothetical protein CB1_000592002 [Camelus ferus]
MREGTNFTDVVLVLRLSSTAIFPGFSLCSYSSALTRYIHPKSPWPNVVQLNPSYKDQWSVDTKVQLGLPPASPAVCVTGQWAAFPLYSGKDAPVQPSFEVSKSETFSAQSTDSGSGGSHLWSIGRMNGLEVDRRPPRTRRAPPTLLAALRAPTVFSVNGTKSSFGASALAGQRTVSSDGSTLTPTTPAGVALHPSPAVRSSPGVSRQLLGRVSLLPAGEAGDRAGPTDGDPEGVSGVTETLLLQGAKQTTRKVGAGGGHVPPWKRSSQKKAELRGELGRGSFQWLMNREALHPVPGFSESWMAA